MYAIGANPVAARLTGIRSKRLIFFGFVLSGTCVALGGLVNVSQLGAATPLAGLGYELSVVTAVILGGEPRRRPRHDPRYRARAADYRYAQQRADPLERRPLLAGGRPRRAADRRCFLRPASHPADPRVGSCSAPTRSGASTELDSGCRHRRIACNLQTINLLSFAARLRHDAHGSPSARNDGRRCGPVLRARRWSAAVARPRVQRLLSAFATRTLVGRRGRPLLALRRPSRQPLQGRSLGRLAGDERNRRQLSTREPA